MQFICGQRRVPTLSSSWVLERGPDGWQIVELHEAECMAMYLSKSNICINIYIFKITYSTLYLHVAAFWQKVTFLVGSF